MTRILTMRRRVPGCGGVACGLAEGSWIDGGFCELEMHDEIVLTAGDGWDEDDFFVFCEWVCPVGEVAIDGNHHAFAFEVDVVFGAKFFK